MNVEQNLGTSSNVAELSDTSPISSESKLRALQNGECLTGAVKRPFIRENKLLGAVLAFEGVGETALLHLKQVGSNQPAERLSGFEIGENIRVRITVSTDSEGRKVWASERGMEHQAILDLVASAPDEVKNIPGTVHSITEFGVFITIEDGLAKGQRGLFRVSAPKGGRVKLGAFTTLNVGQSVTVDVTEARLDDTARLLLRLENVR